MFIFSRPFVSHYMCIWNVRLYGPYIIINFAKFSLLHYTILQKNIYASVSSLNMYLGCLSDPQIVLQEMDLKRLYQYW